MGICTVVCVSGEVTIFGLSDWMNVTTVGHR